MYGQGWLDVRVRDRCSKYVHLTINLRAQLSITEYSLFRVKTLARLPSQNPRNSPTKTPTKYPSSVPTFSPSSKFRRSVPTPLPWQNKYVFVFNDGQIKVGAQPLCPRLYSCVTCRHIQCEKSRGPYEYSAPTSDYFEQERYTCKS